LFPEERGEREELSNSPQIAAAIIHGGLPPLGERQFEERELNERLEKESLEN